MPHMFMHPFVKITLFVVTLLLMNELGGVSLSSICLLLSAYALLVSYKSFCRSVKRMKWLFLSILIIYGFGTPGEYIQLNSTTLLLTKEGCVLGVLQVAKLLLALSMLNILFSTSSKSELMSGLHMLLSPLNALGFNTSKFTARLLLTLDYVEDFANKEKLKFKFDQLDQLLAMSDIAHDNSLVVLESKAFGFMDKLLLVILIFAVSVYAYIKFMDIKVPF